MTLPLDYESRPTPRVRRFAKFAAVIACVAAIGIVWNSTSLAQQLIEWGSCGTGRQAVGQQLYFMMPAACAIPGGCWWFAHGTGLRGLVCRAAFLAAAAGWGVCAVTAG